jgi:superfamily II DNA or RNA helicase
MRSDVFVVDNSQLWKVENYLHEWADLASAFDVATGYFEIGALLALDGQWQKLDKLRILMGDEVSKRTRDALLAGIETVLDTSIEKRKEKDDFLSGVPAIVDALKRKQIECRVYAKKKFHAKAYITHAKQEVVGSTALVGSSNFTVPGLTDNVELNVQIRHEVSVLQDWYEAHWDEGEDITPEVLKVIERHTREYRPFEVYAKALQEYFSGHEITTGEWEEHRSLVYPELDQYQREGYQALMKIARQYSGAFLCDGVGLGKTFIGMMVIERLVERERKRVALFVPKAARKPVWEDTMKSYLPHLGGDFSNLVIFNHTDLLRKGEYQERLERVKEKADAIVIDEAHHFRNPGIKGEGARSPSRYWRLFDIAEGKELFLLTATPINNRLIDLQHMIELFSRREQDYFKAAPLGIHSLQGHFRTMEKELEKTAPQQNGSGNSMDGAGTDQIEAERVLLGDNLFRSLVVQRSRAYVKQSQLQHGGTQAVFPNREAPKVAEYSVKKTYGHLLSVVEDAFNKNKPLFSLAIYYPLAYYKGTDESIDPFSEGRQKQVVGLIRTLFLKRFESSARAFELSCYTLLLKLLAFVTKHSQTRSEKSRLERWKAIHHELVDYIHQPHFNLFGEEPEEEQDEDIVTEELLEDIDELSREEYDVGEILSETFLDLDQIAAFLDELSKFKPTQDDKLSALKRLLKTDPVLKKNKVLIFTEYMATARYLKEELQKAGIEGVDEIDSADKRDDRGKVIRQFAPYYNGSSSAELKAEGLTETRVLISTDVLSEGLNLQDATRLINYDLHWNPVRLMQRIGRVDRRMNPHVEERLIADHPEQKKLRGEVAYWNFLPPSELDNLLKLYSKVAHKTLRISKTFGIEGRKLLTPEDEFEALREFNHSYEGTTTSVEDMHLEYQKLLQDYPDLKVRLDRLPGRVFSGKEHPLSQGKGVFFCYALPAPDKSRENDSTNGHAADLWTVEAGYTQWYLYDVSTEQILEEPSEILDLIRSKPDTDRDRDLPQERLTEIRKKVERHIKNTYLKSVVAPVGVKANLKAWMELT